MSAFLTSLRLVMALPLGAAVYWDSTVWILFCWVLGGLTDMLDGPVARWRGTMSSWGAQFDGIADVFFGVGIILLVCYKVPERRVLILIYVAVLLLTAAVYALMSYNKTGSVLLLHLWTGKLAGWVGYLWFPLALFLDIGGWYYHLLGLVTIFFYVESLIYLLQDRTDLDGRSAFF